jgi:thiol-disulfide isomerase/thioredoxin
MKQFLFPLAAFLIIGGGIFAWQTMKPMPTNETINRSASPMPTQSTQVSPLLAASPASYSGQVIAGTTSPVLVFNTQDYELAKQQNKLIVLYFYANWCPICREEFSKMEAAFNELNNPNVVGFRVNYNDNETDQSEKDLARQFGVAYQHTKIFVQKNERVLKSPETWEKQRYLDEINRQLGAP